ncbi:MAG: transcription factor [Thermoprotei archaeon]|nr:MAG: transcription factor [Thermoprotei archaeon]RLF25452.1 MAG: transcription factor [Thermoprotei archaeon]
MSEYSNITKAVKCLFGDIAAKIVEVLMKAEGELSDEEIAKRGGLRINDVRRALYEMHANHVVSYRRVRSENSHWFVYLWRVNTEDIKYLLQKRKRLVLKVLKQRLEYEKNNIFFKCRSGKCPRLTFDEALEHSFHCPYCGEELEQEDNSRLIEALEKEIERIEKSLERI